MYIYIYTSPYFISTYLCMFIVIKHPYTVFFSLLLPTSDIKMKNNYHLSFAREKRHSHVRNKTSSNDLVGFWAFFFPGWTWDCRMPMTTGHPDKTKHSCSLFNPRTIWQILLLKRSSVYDSNKTQFWDDSNLLHSLPWVGGWKMTRYFPHGRSHQAGNLLVTIWWL